MEHSEHVIFKHEWSFNETSVVSATAEIVIQMTNLDVNRTHDRRNWIELKDNAM